MTSSASDPKGAPARSPGFATRIGDVLASLGIIGRESAELSADEFSRVLRVADLHLGLYSLYLIPMILLHRGVPGWNVPAATAGWIVFLGVNLAISLLSPRNPRLWESIRLGVIALGLCVIFPWIGGIEGRYWYPFGASVVGISTMHLILPRLRMLPLVGLISLYIMLSMPIFRRLDWGARADAFTRWGFLAMLGSFLIQAMEFLLVRSRNLREEKERFQQLAENISEVFWITSADRRQMIYISPGYELVWGRTCASLYARPWDWVEAIHPEDRARVLETASKEEHPEFDVEYRVVRPDGSIRHIRDRAFAIRDTAGRLIRIAGIAEDVSRLKLAAERLEQQRAALVHSSKMSSLGEMAAGIAHEINNPLMIIQGKAQQILRLSNEAELSRDVLRQYAHKIEETSGRIDRIIRGLRSFAKEDDRSPLEKTSVLKILNDTLAFCEARFQSHGVKLRVVPFRPTLSLECRAVQVSQILLNLLNNAFDAVEGTEQPWVEVEVAERGDLVEVAISDSGPGVPEDLRAKILLPFFSTKGQGKGTGLGLSISRGIAESHGGKLELAAGRPTRFVLSLPKTQRKEIRRNP